MTNPSTAQQDEKLDRPTVAARLPDAGVNAADSRRSPGPGKQYVTYARENDLTVYIDRDSFRFVREFAYDALLRRLNDAHEQRNYFKGEASKNLTEVEALRAERDEAANALTDCRAALRQADAMLSDTGPLFVYERSAFHKIIRAALSRLDGAKS